MPKPKGTKEKTKSGIEIEHLGSLEEAGIELTEADMAKADLLTVQADAEDDACRVNFRWTREQLTLCKMVAERIGVPYQTYIKQVLFERVIEDMRRLSEAQNNALKASDVPLLPISTPLNIGLTTSSGERWSMADDILGSTQSIGGVIVNPLSSGLGVTSPVHTPMPGIPGRKRDK